MEELEGGGDTMSPNNTEMQFQNPAVTVLIANPPAPPSGSGTYQEFIVGFSIISNNVVGTM